MDLEASLRQRDESIAVKKRQLEKVEAKANKELPHQRRMCLGTASFSSSTATGVWRTFMVKTVSKKSPSTLRPYTILAEAEYEAMTGANGVPKATEGVRVTEEPHVEFFSPGVIEVDPHVTALTDED